MKRYDDKLSGRQRRLRYAVRRLRWLAVVLLVTAGLILGDRLGMFGRRRPLARGDYESYHGKAFRVVYVVDGDTLDVNAPDGRRDRTRVRLWGVDTPETRHPDKAVQHFGPEATAFTRQACAGREVTLGLVHGTTRGRHGRLLAYVTVAGGRMLNRQLVRLGYAYADPRYEHPRKGEFERLQAEAMAARRGLWRDVRNADLPYYYRDSLPLPRTR